jgi:hypothetical protein
MERGYEREPSDKPISAVGSRVVLRGQQHGETGQELVDGKLSVVMGREEIDQCRTGQNFGKSNMPECPSQMIDSH